MSTAASTPTATHPLETLHERDLQRLVRMVLTDSARLWHDADGRALQVLSTGEWNLNAGPDFKHVALLAEGRLCVGDGEFHRKTSDWVAHQHSQQAAYRGLLLHIALYDDAHEPFAAYTLIVPREDMEWAWQREQAALRVLDAKTDEARTGKTKIFAVKKNDGENTVDGVNAVDAVWEVISPEASSNLAPQAVTSTNNGTEATLEFLRDYALRRLNAKTAEARAVLMQTAKQASAEASRIAPQTSLNVRLQALSTLSERFFERQQRQQRRPAMNSAAATMQRVLAAALSASAADSALSDLLLASNDGLGSLLDAALAFLAAEGLGAGIRTEIMVNVLLPLVLALVEEQQHEQQPVHAQRDDRTRVLAWFWALPARNRYAPLARRFPAVPQKKVWHQQGLLAYLAELTPSASNASNMPSVIADSTADFLERIEHLAGMELRLYRQK
jgi:hypothetical protein